MPRLDVILQVAFLGGSILAEGTEKLPRIEVEFNMLLVVAAISGLVLTVGAGKRFGTIVDLSSMSRHLVLVGCQVGTALALERTLTCTQESEVLHPCSEGSRI